MALVGAPSAPCSYVRAMTSPSARAQELFAEHVRRLEAGESSYLDEACREAPELEGELRQLESEWSRMSAVLARLSPTKGPLSERLRAEYGDEVDPEISLSQGGFGGIVDESSAALMGKLSAQGGAERYLTRHEIARGGMGAILKVWDEDLRLSLIHI